MSYPYGAGATPNYGVLGSGPPQYTPNQLLAQQYGQGSRAFYAPFNSPYRPMDVPAGQFQPPRGYGGGFGGMPSPQYGSPPGGGGMFGGMAGQLPPGMPGPSVYQPQIGMQQPTGAARDYYAQQAQASALEGGITPWATAMMNARYGQGMPPGMFGQGQVPGAQGGFAPAQPAFATLGAPGPSPQTGAQYGLEAMRNFASQQNAGPPPSAYQPGSFSAGVAALNRGDPNARNMLGQAAGLPVQSGRDYGLQAMQNFGSQQNAGPTTRLPDAPVGGSIPQGSGSPAQPFLGQAAGLPVQSGRDYGLQAMQNFGSQQNAGPTTRLPDAPVGGSIPQGSGSPAQPFLGQAAGLPVQSGRDYGLQAMQNFGSQQNAGPTTRLPDAPVGGAIAQGSGSPAQPFGPAFRNAVNQLRVRPPAPPQRLPYQAGATSQMHRLGRRLPPVA